MTPALIDSLPKVVLHDHLDGGLRPATVLALSREVGVAVPGLDTAASDSNAADSNAADTKASATDAVNSTAAPAPDTAEHPAADATEHPAADAAELTAAEETRAVADWFHAAADSGSLPAYLSTFERTLALMQTAPHLRRIAREFVEDMVADGVVYAETRWAPHQHTEGGLTLDEAVQAVQDGLDEGVAAAAESGRRIVVGQLLCYLRHLDPTDELVDIALARRDSGVLGLDLAGPEAGHPASWFRSQFERARENGLRVTIHAGEADGPTSIADALDCGAERIGHGVRLVEDITLGGDGGDGGGADADRLGRIARRVLDERICLEVCPSSNLQTGVAEDIAGHPVATLHRHGFALALSCDNRLMSRTSTSRETALVAQALGWGLDDVQRVVLTGLENGFAPAEQRQMLRDEVVLPIFDAVRGTGRGGQDEEESSGELGEELGP
ncbi:adenosine deaminase family protein [Brachybacterium sp. AOP43-C2-M15]|uniref:adenosine deaminase family protein n=1 Tax=Brachybacterium sp. AOP43-C2-M15 TaxID=3457661 RepID=UPI004033C670